MHLSNRHQIILVNNPRCATVAVAAMLSAEAYPSLPAYAMPKDARKVISDEEWDARRKMIVVRDPVARFISTVRALRDLNTDGSLAFCTPDESEYLTGLRAAAQGGTFGEGAALVIEALATLPAGKVPDLFKPQGAWLSCKFDFIVALPDLALFANKMKFGKPIMHRNRSNAKGTSLPAVVEDQVRAFYEKDFARFANLFVWTPDPLKPRLLTGPCKSCAVKLKAGITEGKSTPPAADAEGNTPALTLPVPDGSQVTHGEEAAAGES